MDTDKISSNKLYIFLDWIWKIVVLNLFTLITSLAVFTIIPSFTACYKSIKDYKEGSEKNILKIYFGNFRINFLRNLLSGIFITFLFALLGLAVDYYYANLEALTSLGKSGLFLYFGYYFLLFCILILILICNQLPMIYTLFNFRFFDNYRFAFFVTFKFLKKSLLMFGCWIGSGLIILFMRPIWFSIGISLPLLFIYNISKPVYWSLLSENEEENERKDEER